MNFFRQSSCYKKLKNSSLKSSLYYIQSIRKWAEKFQNNNIQMQLEWVPGHMNIKRNELADKAAKKETKLQRTAIESYISIVYIKRKIKESALIDWTSIWQASKVKEKQYSYYENNKEKSLYISQYVYKHKKTLRLYNSM